MKKIMAIFLTVLIAISFTACTMNPLTLFKSYNKASKKGNKTKIEQRKENKDDKVKNNNKQNKKSSKS